MEDEFPAEGMALMHILVVNDIKKSKSFYTDVLGVHEAETHPYEKQRCEIRRN
jgi:catechol-2,3-dioxygenase